MKLIDALNFCNIINENIEKGKTNFQHILSVLDNIKDKINSDDEVARDIEYSIDRKPDYQQSVINRVYDITGDDNVKTYIENILDGRRRYVRDLEIGLQNRDKGRKNVLNEVFSGKVFNLYAGISKALNNNKNLAKILINATVGYNNNSRGKFEIALALLYPNTTLVSKKSNSGKDGDIIVNNEYIEIKSINGNKSSNAGKLSNNINDGGYKIETVREKIDSTFKWYYKLLADKFGCDEEPYTTLPSGVTFNTNSVDELLLKPIKKVLKKGFGGDVAKLRNAAIIAYMNVWRSFFPKKNTNTYNTISKIVIEMSKRRSLDEMCNSGTIVSNREALIRSIGKVYLRNYQNMKKFDGILVIKNENEKAESIYVKKESIEKGDIPENIMFTPPRLDKSAGRSVHMGIYLS